METTILRSRTLLAIGTDIPLATGFEFISENLRAMPTMLELAGWRGTRSQLASQLITATWAVSGSIIMQPSLGEMARLLPWIVGEQQIDVPAGSVSCTLTETIPPLTVMIDRGTRVYAYSGCKIVVAELTGKNNAPLILSLSFEGMTEAVTAAGTFPAVAYRMGPLLRFASGEVTIAGAQREIEHVTITIENVARTDRFANSAYRVDVPIIDRRIRLRCAIPYSDDTHDIYESAALAGPATLRFFAANTQVTWEFPSVRFGVASAIVVDGTEQIQLDGLAGRTLDDDALVVIHTNDG